MRSVPATPKKQKPKKGPDKNGGNMRAWVGLPAVSLGLHRQLRVYQRAPRDEICGEGVALDHVVAAPLRLREGLQPRHVLQPLVQHDVLVPQQSPHLRHWEWWVG